MPERQKILKETEKAKIGTEAHSLRAQAQNSRSRFDYCPKCIKLVHASLQCACGQQAVSVPAEEAPERKNKMEGFFIQRGVEYL